MAMSKTRTPEETAAIVSATAIARGKDIAQTHIVGLLGRGKPFVRVHVGITDVDLGKVPQERAGYTVAAIYAGGSQHTVAAVGKVIGEWLLACHGKRYDPAPEKPVLKPGQKTLFLAIAYAETTAGGKSKA